MKKIIVTLLIFFSFQLAKAEKYALIIAIGNYDYKTTGWSKISSTNDVPLIEQTLINQNFKKENITLLIDEAATFAGIKAALDNLLSTIKPDDIVVIHYSGHGQQIYDDDIDEEIDGKDEALVPYDANSRYSDAYTGQNHFRDDELGNYITKLRNTLQTKGQLLLLLDSCHSGSSTRGGSARGSKSVFAPVGWESKKTEVEKGSDMTEKSKEKLTENAAPFVLISGASANELNYEYKGFGSLSYAFSKAMSKLGSNYSYNQLFAKIKAEMNIISPKQSPTIEGDKNMALFNDKYIKQEPYFEVVSISKDTIVKIQAGRLQGLFENTTVNILPAATTKFTEEAVLAKGTITLSKFNEAVIKLDRDLPDANEKNYWVFIDELSYGDIAVDIYFHESLKDQAIKDGVANFLSEKKLGNIVKDSLMADAVLMQNGNTITLNATNGLDAVDKDANTRGATSVEDINKKIFNFSQGQYLKKFEIKNYDYEFDFKLIPVEFDEAKRVVKNLLNPKDFENENGILQVRAGVDDVVLQVTNKGNKPFYFSIIEIYDTGLILPLMPNVNCDLNDDERKLAPGQTMTFKDCVFSFAPPYEKLLLKGFASSTPINFQSTVETRGADTRGSSNPLEKFLSNSYSQSRGRTSTKVTGKLEGFSTELIYEIVKE
ncbi:peptidase C14, caspase catalytic subunit p20 [Psychroflexus torquis ATCC 700755]|uniref:Peptidase C14, caspase catalytic subunit p20 n=1 Tax=Psychroflexus torquis (strain ATCC 700755 / CIP 106069 / ACAM 623) TaxID=313595 RepID=K4IRS8_PSYTT|nr:caspase family protein [Psychroflexus torquis]AFU68175.1 peptidase C14, caspase catalytic subunit p20 [Psychroflexus torquis ATCC 700755]